ncbi:MAG: DMT family transporter [Chitinophagaceae bacterium]|nr:DMT family transporter [Chitinophagaceae bacterium]
MKNSALVWIFFIVICFIWGSSFILMKEGMVALSPYQVASVRVLSAGLVLLPVAIQTFKKVPRSKMLLIALSGLLGTFFPAYLFCIAETKIDSSLAGILNALTPLFTVFIGALFFQLRLPFKKIAGVVTGFAGLLLLLLDPGKKIQLQFWGYASFVLLATICYGANVNMVNRYLKDTGSKEIAAIAFAILIPSSLVILYATGYFKLDLLAAGVMRATLASIILGIFGTAIASIMFYVLLKKAGPVFSSMVTYGIPFVAIFWGLLAGEEVTVRQILCLSVILAGVYFARK